MPGCSSAGLASKSGPRRIKQSWPKDWRKQQGRELGRWDTGSRHRGVPGAAPEHMPLLESQPFPGFPQGDFPARTITAKLMAKRGLSMKQETLVRQAERWL